MSIKINAVSKLLIGDGIICLLLCWFLFALPARLFVSPTSYVVEAANGELLNAAIASDGQWRFPAADSVPDKFAKCIIAFEDKRFYQHPGIDLLAMVRAMRQNFRAKGIVSGGSTLTMQTIRLSRRQDRTIIQKLFEIFLALRLEVRHKKKRNT